MTAFEKWSVWISSVLCGGTGVAYFFVKYFMEPAQPWDAVNHPIQPWLLKAHIVTAPLLVFALGAVAGNHFWKHYRSGVPTGRRTGITAMLSVAPMVITGYLIQVVTNQGWLTAMAWSHIAFGTLYLAGLILHQKVFRGRKNRRRRKNELPVMASEKEKPEEEAGVTVGQAKDAKVTETAEGRPTHRSSPPPGQGDRPTRRSASTPITAALLVLAGALAGADALEADTSRDTTRTYYVAAEEVVWDYAPAGRDLTMGRPFGPEDSVFVARGSERIGSEYRKAVYREYTDSTFTTRKPVPERWEHKGILGPVLRGEVGDTIRVVFRNLGSRPYTLHPHGVFYDKANEGAPTNDGTSGSLKEDDRVEPGRTRVYTWPVPERAGPGPSDPSSIVWLYHSHVDEPADTNAGLIGVILVTREGMAGPGARPTDVDREFVSLFKVFDENVSGYLEENVEALAGAPARVDPGDPDFQESNLMHAINGWVYGSMPVLTMRQGERTRWYIVDLGTEVDLHTAHWHGSTATVRGHRTDVVELMPGSMKVADIVPDSPGTWMYHCHVDDHIAAGMTARYRVLPPEGGE